MSYPNTTLYILTLLSLFQYMLLEQPYLSLLANICCLLFFLLSVLHPIHHQLEVSVRTTFFINSHILLYSAWYNVRMILKNTCFSGKGRQSLHIHVHIIRICRMLISYIIKLCLHPPTRVLSRIFFFGGGKLAMVKWILQVNNSPPD